MRKQILESDIIRTAMTLAWPVMLSNAFQTVYNLTDAFWLGKVGSEAVAAPSIAWPIIFLLISLSGGFGIAGLALGNFGAAILSLVLLSKSNWQQKIIE